MNINNIYNGKIPDELNMIIEITPDCQEVKYELDKDSGALFVDRFIPVPMFYPLYYGFVPNTLGGDGDPLDLLLFCNQKLIVGSVIPVRPIGMLVMEDESGDDEKIIVVPQNKITKEYSHIKNYDDLNQSVLNKIKHFFEHYKDLENEKWVKVKDFQNVEEAKKLLIRCNNLTYITNS